MTSEQALTEDELRLCYLPATEVMAAFRAGSLKPSELLDVLLRRIEAVNPLINALTDTYFEEAKTKALAADQAYADGSATGAMEGLPILVKDAQRVQGQRTTFGSHVSELDVKLEIHTGFLRTCSSKTCGKEFIPNTES